MDRKNGVDARKRGKHTRHVMIGKHMFRVTEQPHAEKMKDSSFWVLKFNMTTDNPGTNALERMTGFVNPELLHLLKGNSHLRTCSSCFAALHLLSQSIVFIDYEKKTELHVHVSNSLVAGQLHLLMVRISTTDDLKTTGKSE